MTLDSNAIRVDVRLIFAAFETARNELDGTGVVHAQGILNDVEMVRAPITVLAPAVIEEAAPAAAIIALDALLIVRSPRRRAEPAVIIEVLRRWFRRQRRRRGERTEPCANHFDITDPAIAHDLGCFAKGAVRALLRSRLQHASVTSRRVDEHSAFAHRQREGFLTINTLAREHGGFGDGRVPVI